MDKIPIIIGPTAGGKTSLAVELALRSRERSGLACEIISADSMLIYRGMNIGVAKPTMEERKGIVHHCIDVVDIDKPYSVQEWLKDSQGAISSMQTRGVQPVVVGGTHLYIKALIDGLFEGPGGDEEVRERLRQLDLVELRRRLELVDPQAAARIHPNDQRRSIRALEVHELTGTTLSAMQGQWDREHKESPYRIVLLEWEVEAINRRINERVRQMIAAGLVDEAKALFDSGRMGMQAKEALGYKQLFEHFTGQFTLEEAIERIKIDTRRFAKAQRTWAKRSRMHPGNITLRGEEGGMEMWPVQVLDVMNVNEG